LLQPRGSGLLLAVPNVQLTHINGRLPILQYALYGTMSEKISHVPYIVGEILTRYYRYVELYFNCTENC